MSNGIITITKRVEYKRSNALDESSNHTKNRKKEKNYNHIWTEKTCATTKIKKTTNQKYHQIKSNNTKQKKPRKEKKEKEPRNEGILLVTCVSHESSRTEVDGDRARVFGRKTPCQESIFQCTDGFRIGCLQSIWALGHWFLKHCQHFFSFFFSFFFFARRCNWKTMNQEKRQE